MQFPRTHLLSNATIFPPVSTLYPSSRNYFHSPTHFIRPTLHTSFIQFSLRGFPSHGTHLSFANAIQMPPFTAQVRQHSFHKSRFLVGSILKRYNSLHIRCLGKNSTTILCKSLNKNKSKKNANTRIMSVSSSVSFRTPPRQSYFATRRRLVSQ